MGSILYLFYFVSEVLTILSKGVNKLIAWAQGIERTQEMPGCVSHKPGHGLQIPLLYLLFDQHDKRSTVCNLHIFMSFTFRSEMVVEN